MFFNGNDFDISSVCESSKKNSCLNKIRIKGKGKGSKIYISSMGKGASFFRGGEISRFLGGREVRSVFAIKGYKGEVGVCQ